MTIWQPSFEGKSGPRYRQIADAIGESIADGSLTKRERLPTQRALADQLGISLNTVSRAYAEATRRGFLSGEVGRGTFIRDSGPVPASWPAGMTRPSDGPIDFSLNLPCAGESASALAETLECLQRSPSLRACLDYQAGGDLRHHTEAGAEWIGQLGLDTSGDNVVLTNGAQHGLMVAMLASMRPGDALLTESLTYAPTMALARQLGLKLIPVAMDGEGLMPDALDSACRTTGARTLYCLPTIHTPTTATMTTERRQAIARIANAHDLTVIEDDVFGFLPQNRPPPLACFAPERTLFVTSVSKSLAPGLRVGYVCAPRKYLRSVRAAVTLSCWMPPPLTMEIVSQWIVEGTARRLNEFQRLEAQVRQRIAQGILGQHGPQAHPCGLHLWLPLPPHWRADAFRAAAEKQGVKILTGETFSVRQSDAPHAVRLCLSHEPTRGRMTRGLEIIAGLLGENGDSGDLVV